jgi:hypothetical protein
MARIAESVHVPVSLAETWDYYFSERGWTLWVDGFAAVDRTEGYPQAGGSLRWRSTPAGRGTVTEHVLEHEPRRLHRIAFGDPSTTGELTTRFEIAGEGTRVTQELEYKLRQGGAFSWLTDLFFVRSQMRRSLARSLERFKHEVEEISEVSENSP